MRATEPTGDKRIALPDGDYTLDFYLKSGKFYSFPFSVAGVIGGAGAGKSTLLNGDWNNWGYLLYAGADPDQQLVWKVWLRSGTPGRDQGFKVSVVTTPLEKSRLMCTSRPNVTTSVRTEWDRREFDFIHPMQGTSGGAMFYARELLGADGAYTLKMDIDGRHYGTWRFRVQGGRLVKTGRADPATADPLRFIDGGADAWWYCREEAGQADAAGGAEPQVIPGAKRLTVNGHTMVPLRSIFEWLGCEVKYIPQAKSIYASLGDDIIVLMRLDESEATVNGKKVPLPQPPLQRDGVTWVPLRFVAETFGAEVGFDGDVITITAGDRVGTIP